MAAEKIGARLRHTGSGRVPGDAVAVEIIGLGIGDGQGHAAQSVNDILNIVHAENGVLIDLDAELGGDNVQQRVNTIVFGDVGEAADSSVRAANEHFPGQRAEDDTALDRIQRYQHHAVRITQIVGVAIPGIGAEKQIMMHSLGGFGHFVGAERGDLPRSDGGQRTGRKQQQQTKQKSNQTLVHGNRLLSGPGGKTESEGENQQGKNST